MLYLGPRQRPLGPVSAGLVSFAVCLAVAAPAAAGPGEAFRHLDAVFDRHHLTFGVYRDLADAGNHFPARCAIVRNPQVQADLAAVQFDETHTQGCRSGTCIRNTFTARDPGYWGGFYFQNGYLAGQDVVPRCNDGSVNAHFDLTGATRVTFWARGAVGGERIELFAGGLGRNADTGTATHPYPDSFERTPERGETITLTAEWQPYDIPLAGLSLERVAGGFAWVASAALNPAGATFYLDDIAYDVARPNALRLLTSYETLAVGPANDFDNVHRNVAFSYDNAVVLLAYLARGTTEDLRRARLLADAFVYAQDRDRFYTDGRLRNAYQGGDLVLPPGWTPNGRIGTARMPGRWDATQGWVEEQTQVGSDTGNMAWITLALARAGRTLGDRAYLDAARRLGTWIETETRDARGAGGYTGGYEGHEPAPARRAWKSTEHNLDLAAAFMLISDAVDEPESSLWRARAMHARSFVRSMWEACGAQHFATGTGIDGVTPNCGLVPTDVNTWGVMVLGELAQYGAGIDWVDANGAASSACGPGAPLAGIDFNDDRDGVWWEGTAHAVIANRILQRGARADALLGSLRLAQAQAPRYNGLGLVAACQDGLTTGAGFVFYNRLHAGATAWYALAELGHNPFWGLATTAAIPHQDVDRDGLSDDWEARYGLSAASGAGADGADGDPDGDGVTNAAEQAAHSHPRGFVVRYFAEGATGAFFRTRLAVANAGAGPSRVLVRLLRDDGTRVGHDVVVPAHARQTLLAEAILGPGSSSFSTIVEADAPIAADRTQSWDSTGYGSHAETAVLAPSTTWFFAEGSTAGPFHLFYLLQNPDAAAVDATVTFLRPSGAPIVRSYQLPPLSRTTIYVDQLGGALEGTDVSAAIAAARPIIAERAMYLDRPGQPFAGGLGSAGVTAAALEWFLAEGATGSFFELFVLIANPNPTAAIVDVDYLLADGRVLAKRHTVGADSRFTIWVDEEELPAGSGQKPLASQAVATRLRSANGVPIVVERTMWWPQPDWYEGHNSPGATTAAAVWLSAEGETGGAAAWQTYVLIANTSGTSGQARVTLLFEDGPTAERTVPLPANSRTTVPVGALFPESDGRRYGVLVESLGAAPAALVVERAMYADGGGVTWGAGTNALTTPLP